RQLTELANPGDRIIVIAAQDHPRIIADIEADDLEDLVIDFDELTAWDGGSDMKSAVESGLEKLVKSQAFRSEIFIVSDFFSAEELPQLAQNVAAFIVPVAQRNLDNLSVSSVKVLNEILEPGLPIDLEVTIRNRGTHDKEGIYYSLYLDGQRVGENVVTIAADGEISVQHQLSVEKTGLHSGMVQLEEIDALALDNRYYFCFSVPEAVNVLLVESITTSVVLRLALSSASEYGELIKLSTEKPTRWDVQQLSMFDVIIFNDPPTFTSAQRNRLKHFMEMGGGVMLLPGDIMDAAQINRSLLEDIKAPLWGEKTTAKPGQTAFRTWKEADFNDVIFKGIFREGGKPVYPKFYQTVALTQSPETIISFDNGAPFLAAKKIGEGQLFLCSSSPDPGWSDWSNRGIFAPLLHRIVLLLAGQGNGKCFALEAGDDFILDAKPEMGSAVELSQQSGTSVKLPLLTLGRQAVFQQKAMNPVGAYTVASDQLDALCAVNMPESEADLKRIDIEAQFLDWFEVGAIICQPDEILTKVQHSRYGRELWKTALLFGVLLLIGESALGRAWSKESGRPETTIKN
ncbi:VWA domain-containing protein, partial [bacterium]|nr:VWA domain-containing protein [bacterium]